MTVATDAERLMLDLVNGARADAGLDALTLETHLNASADAHSDWMLAQDVFSHTGAGAVPRPTGCATRASTWRARG